MKQLAKMFTLAIVCAAVGHLATRTVQTQGSACLVTTASGAVQGVNLGASCAFLGVPFAAAPAGNLRWKSPQPAAAWAPAVLNATVAPPNCAQLNSGTGLPSGSEDCLKLNVWTPNPPGSHPAPVIVWLHPGSFAAASANFPPHNGQSLAARTGAIVVAPNYRLGAFGFLGHAALAAEGDGAGNYGLLDQRAALVWVREHVAAFGGDPGRVTIAGESAGAHSVSLHLVSPGSAGLFHRAIMESGTASFQWRTAAEAESQGNAFATAIGCTDADAPALLACLRSKSRDQVLLAHPPPLFEQITETGRTQWTPVVDGYEIPDQPRRLYRRGAFTRVPIVLGANRDEGWTFVNRSFPASVTPEQYEAVVDTEFGADAAKILAAYPVANFASPKHALARLAGDLEYTCEARRVARLISKTGTPVFLYSFEYEVDPVVPDLVVHGLEVNFVFGNNFGPPLFANYVLNAADLALSHAMGGYWTRFAATGNPNTHDRDVVRWPKFEHSNGHRHERGNYIAFGTETKAAAHFGGGRCRVWNRSFFRSVTGAVAAATP